MATRIRLQRQGKKNQPFYHIVVTDGRAPRNGSYIERLGTYNPLTHPADVKINFDRALYWIEVGASPSDTARSLLKHEGVYLMKHLKGGIAKGAISENEAQRRFDVWKQERESKLNNARREADESKRKTMKTRLEAESKVREAIEAKVTAKRQAIAEEQAKKEAEAAALAAESGEPIPVPEAIEATEEE